MFKPDIQNPSFAYLGMPDYSKYKAGTGLRGIGDILNAHNQARQFDNYLANREIPTASATANTGINYAQEKPTLNTANPSYNYRPLGVTGYPNQVTQLETVYPYQAKQSATGYPYQNMQSSYASGAPTPLQTGRKINEYMSKQQSGEANAGEGVGLGGLGSLGLPIMAMSLLRRGSGAEPQQGLDLMNLMPYLKMMK